jgi:hypothetical protein
LNKINYIFILILYILSSQIYPFVHSHTHQHEDVAETCLSIHPPEHHHEDANTEDDHQEEDHHFVGDLQYISSTSGVLLPIMFTGLILDNMSIKPITSEIVHIIDVPPKIPTSYILRSIPSRASPKLV